MHGDRILVGTGQHFPLVLGGSLSAQIEECVGGFGAGIHRPALAGEVPRVVGVVQHHLLDAVFDRRIGSKGRTRLHFNEAQGVLEGDIDPFVDELVVGVVIVAAPFRHVVGPAAIGDQVRIHQVVLRARCGNYESIPGEAARPRERVGNRGVGGGVGPETQVAGCRPIIVSRGGPAQVDVVIGATGRTVPERLETAGGVKFRLGVSSIGAELLPRVVGRADRYVCQGGLRL